MFHIPILWFASGYLALITWEWIQEKLLAFLSLSPRDLEYEYILKCLLGQNEELRGNAINSIEVNKSGPVVIKGGFNGKGLNTIKNIVMSVVGCSEEDITLSQLDAH
jgi:hypothetical protein